MKQLILIGALVAGPAWAEEPYDVYIDTLYGERGCASGAAELSVHNDGEDTLPGVIVAAFMKGQSIGSKAPQTNSFDDAISALLAQCAKDPTQSVYDAVVGMSE
ncbi:MAG: hypothetical protein AAFQ12_14285 [Pseudomonadota bacterium]